MTRPRPGSSAVARMSPGSPFLTRVSLRAERVVPGRYPFTIPLLANGLEFELTTPVTFLVGENGSGKSTLLEALAWSVGFGAHGGNRDHAFEEGTDGHALGRALKLAWRQRTTTGFFLQILHHLSAPRNAQCIIATHSPMLLAFPGATVFSLDDGSLTQVDYRDTDHYRVTREFLDAPERFFRYLCEEPEDK